MGGEVCDRKSEVWRVSKRKIGHYSFTKVTLNVDLKLSERSLVLQLELSPLFKLS